MPPLTTPTCSICNYSLVGIEPNETNRLTCPECGTLLKPASPNAVFTKQKYHLLFLYILVIPTLITSFAGYIGVYLPDEFSLLTFIFHVLINPFIFLALWIIASSTVFTRSKRYPRPYPRWTALLWGLLYCLPGIAMFFITFSAYRYWY